MKEQEIRPSDLFEKYLTLSKEDAIAFDSSCFIKTDCVACGSSKLFDKIEKNNFEYKLCENCNSLFCNPRPTQQILNHFYYNSKSSKFWFEEFLPVVEQSRKEKMFKKKAVDLQKLIERHKIGVTALCDCGAGSGLFIEELRILLPNINFSAIEPGESSYKILSNKGIKTLNKTVEDAYEWYNKFDFITCLEVFEHVFSPNDFLLSLSKLLNKGGYCLLTTLGYEGFDIQTLKGESNSISPPHHLNFFSIEGFKNIFKKCDFKIIEILTPGVLDVDIVLNSKSCPDYLKVIQSRGEEALEGFQEFLIKHKLSSHVWVLAQKI